MALALDGIEVEDGAIAYGQPSYHVQDFALAESGDIGFVGGVIGYVLDLAIMVVDAWARRNISAWLMVMRAIHAWSEPRP